jgi:hypothetical protein
MKGATMAARAHSRCFLVLVRDGQAFTYSLEMRSKSRDNDSLDRDFHLTTPMALPLDGWITLAEIQTLRRGKKR